MVGRIHRTCCGRKGFITQGRTREFFSWVSIRAAEKSGIGHSIYTHFPMDRNCDICRKTKITRTPCKKRSGAAITRAEKFGDLITANHKVLSELCESRNNHRYAIVVQDLATPWIQSCPCNTKTSQETEKSLRKFLEPSEKPRVIYTDNSTEFGKACEDLSYRSETNGIAERAVRRVKEGTSAVLLQWGLDEKRSADSLECYCYLRSIQDLLSEGKTLYERRFGEPLKGPIIPFGSMIEYHPISAKDLSRPHQFGKSVLPGMLPRLCLACEVNLDRRHFGRRLSGVGKDGRISNPRLETQRPKWWTISYSRSHMEK